MSDYFCTGGQRRPGPDQNDCREDGRHDRRDNCRDNDRDDCRHDRCDNRRDNDREHCRDDCRDDRCDNRRDDCCDNRRDDCCDDDCSCRRGFVQTLQTLLRTGLSSLVDFSTMAFVTNDFVVGSALTAPDTCAASYDNLSEELTATFSRFTHCSCDDIDVTGPVFFPVVGGADTGLTVSRLDLCDLLAVAFSVLGDTAGEVTENYQTARRLFQTLLRHRRRDDAFPPYPDPCDEPCDCGREERFSGSISLFAGPLLLANVTVLGQLDGVLVLANDTDQRFYFVCADDAIIIR